jgi:Secretion system C-terminal sorting domain
MKKLLLLSLILIGLKGNTQIIYQENFQTITSLTTSGWTLYNDTNTPQGTYATIFPDAWNIVAWNAEGTNKTASCPSWFTPAAVADRWLITPPIVVPSGTGTVNLTFKVRSHDPDVPFQDGYSLKLSTTNNVKTSFTVNLITVVNAPNTLISATALTTLDLSAYSGQTIRLAWINTSNDKNLLSVDDIKVEKSVLSTNSFLDSKFSISPNPTNDFVNISNSENIKVPSIKITDLNGRVVKQSNFDSVSDIKMNVSDLSSGIYMMNINSNEGSVTKKIIKN